MVSGSQSRSEKTQETNNGESIPESRFDWTALAVTLYWKIRPICAMARTGGIIPNDSPDLSAHSSGMLRSNARHGAVMTSVIIGQYTRRMMRIPLPRTLPMMGHNTPCSTMPITAVAITGAATPGGLFLMLHVMITVCWR